MSAPLAAQAGLVLQSPWWLLAALLVPLALFWRRQRGEPSLRFAPGSFLRGEREGETLGSWRVRLLPVPPVLAAFGLLLVVLALARPQHRVRLPLETEGIDILLCLDVSSSMAARDMDPRRTRLDVAREEAARFIAERPADRIGLIGFARFPDLVCPPTLDHGALSSLLSGVKPVERDGPEDATGIGIAVARAAEALQGSVAQSRVAILLTDGEENVATARTPDEIGPLPAAWLCRELGVRVYTIAAGGGGPSSSGAQAALDQGPMRALAEVTGGAYHEARDAEALARVYARIDQLERVERVEPRYEVEERFLPLLALAVALLLLARLLRMSVLEVLP